MTSNHLHFWEFCCVLVMIQLFLHNAALGEVFAMPYEFMDPDARVLKLQSANKKDATSINIYNVTLQTKQKLAWISITPSFTTGIVQTMEYGVFASGRIDRYGSHLAVIIIVYDSTRAQSFQFELTSTRAGDTIKNNWTIHIPATEPDSPPSDGSRQDSLMTVPTLVFGIISVVLLLLMVVFVYCTCRRRRRQNYTKTDLDTEIVSSVTSQVSLGHKSNIMFRATSDPSCDRCKAPLTKRPSLPNTRPPKIVYKDGQASIEGHTGVHYATPHDAGSLAYNRRNWREQTYVRNNTIVPYTSPQDDIHEESAEEGEEEEQHEDSSSPPVEKDEFLDRPLYASVSMC